MKEFKIFHETVRNPSIAAERAKEKGQKILGYLCSYAPEEIIYAAGFHPLRIFPSKSETGLAEHHLQSYCCSPVRGVLEDVLSGRLDFLSGTVFPHTCDSIQRLGDIWRLNIKSEFFSNIVMPVKLNSQSSKDYMFATLKRFKSDLESFKKEEISDDAINESIMKFNMIRGYLKSIYDLHSKNPGIIKGSDLHAIVKGAMIMDRDELLKLLPIIISNLKDMKPSQSKAIRIAMSGSICDSPDIYDIIEDAGGVIVADDLCTGQRWFDSLIPERKDPIQALTTRYVERIICPAKHHSNTLRAENILKLIKNNDAKGIIFMIMKFCDPHAFDYPDIKNFLDNAGIKSTLIEMDNQNLNTGQLSTRLETFIQML